MELQALWVVCLWRHIKMPSLYFVDLTSTHMKQILSMFLFYSDILFLQTIINVGETKNKKAGEVVML